jgi:transcriptional regulator with XRE-family HTH domain
MASDTIGAAVRENRLEQGITRAGLARATGLAAARVAAIESADCDASGGEIAGIARALGVDPRRLLRGVVVTRYRGDAGKPGLAEAEAVLDRIVDNYLDAVALSAGLGSPE